MITLGPSLFLSLSLSLTLSLSPAGLLTMSSMPAFGYDPDATPYEEMSSGHLPGDIDESPPKVRLITHDGCVCFSFTDDETGWIKAVRKLRKKSASSAHPKEWRIDRSAYWDAGEVGDLVRFYHICFASDLPPLAESDRALDAAGSIAVAAASVDSDREDEAD